jgi:hypothetical protein
MRRLKTHNPKVQRALKDTDGNPGLSWSQADIDKARRELSEDSDILRDDPTEDEPALTRSEQRRRGFQY